ncbi:hypothetical protein FHR29_004992 [Sphingobacterium sp. JUb56]|nr:hypothetical protein [Sphingobacterium sp. JUb56]
MSLKKVNNNEKLLHPIYFYADKTRMKTKFFK